MKSLYKTGDVSSDFDSITDTPGRYPYTRGIHESGYGGKLWTMRQFSGFGTPEETNQR